MIVGILKARHFQKVIVINKIGISPININVMNNS